MKKSSQWTKFMQLRKEAWKKFRTSTGFEPVTSRYRCDALPTELWSHWRWEQVKCGEEVRKKQPKRNYPEKQKGQPYDNLTNQRIIFYHE